MVRCEASHSARDLEDEHTRVGRRLHFQFRCHSSSCVPCPCHIPPCAMHVHETLEKKRENYFPFPSVQLKLTLAFLPPLTLSAAELLSTAPSFLCVSIGAVTFVVPISVCAMAYAILLARVRRTAHHKAIEFVPSNTGGGERSACQEEQYCSALSSGIEIDRERQAQQWIRFDP